MIGVDNHRSRRHRAMDFHTIYSIVVAVFFISVLALGLTGVESN